MNSRCGSKVEARTLCEGSPARSRGRRSDSTRIRKAVPGTWGLSIVGWGSAFLPGARIGIDAATMLVGADLSPSNLHTLTPPHTWHKGDASVTIRSLILIPAQLVS